MLYQTSSEIWYYKTIEYMSKSMLDTDFDKFPSMLGRARQACPLRCSYTSNKGNKMRA